MANRYTSIFDAGDSKPKPWSSLLSVQSPALPKIIEMWTHLGITADLMTPSRLRAEGRTADHRLIKHLSSDYYWLAAIAVSPVGWLASSADSSGVHNITQSISSVFS